MNINELESINNYIGDVSYICTDMFSVYSDWCDKNGYTHYVEPSTYWAERKARGYIDTDNLYHKLTKQEYAKDEAINRQMYKENVIHILKIVRNLFHSMNLMLLDINLNLVLMELMLFIQC